MVSVYASIGKLLGKGENVGYQHFLCFPKGLEKAVSSVLLKFRTMCMCDHTSSSKISNVINLDKSNILSSGIRVCVIIPVL